MNKIEQLRVDRLKVLGCAACAYLDIMTPAEELHHLLDGGRRMGDWYTVFLCRGHHQGDQWHEHIPQEYRVSIKHGRKLFNDMIAPERVLWDMVQERLGLAWPRPKIVARRTA